MKTRNVIQYVTTTQDSFNKSTHVRSVTQSRPSVGVDQLVVLQDQLHGDFKTIYGHEFRRGLGSDYVGTRFQDTPSETLLITGKIATFTRTPTLPSVGVLRNDAIGDLYNKLRSGGVGSGLDLSVDAAEGRQVLKMVSDVGKLSRFVRSFSPKNWGNKWLEYQYGWRPLVNSIYGTFDALMHRRLYEYQRVKGKSRSGSTWFATYDDFNGVGSREIVKQDTSYRYMVVAEFKTKNTIQQQLSGYTSLNPVSIAWELLPYSFVVDWVYDIGGYLKALEGALLFGQGFVRGYEVGGYKVRNSGTLLTYKQAIAGTTTLWQAEGFQEYSYKVRIPLGVSPMPTVPQFNANLGWQRLVSAASLMSQHLRK